jgi:hypothetical protein
VKSTFVNPPIAIILRPCPSLLVGASTYGAACSLAKSYGIIVT